MKVILFLIISGISNGSEEAFNYQLQKEYSNSKECVQASIIMRKVLTAEDNLQARETDVYAYCKVNKEGLSPEEYLQENNKIRRLEKFYTTAKW